MRARNIRARNEIVERGTVTKSHKWKRANAERRVGECYQWKSTGQCSKGDSCSFSQDPASGKRCDQSQEGQSSSPAPKAKAQTDGNFFKGPRSRGESPSWTRDRKPCKDFLGGKCTNPSCNLWHLPCVTNTTLNPDARMVTNVDSDMLMRLMGSPVKSRRQVVRKDQLPCWRSLYNWIVSQDRQVHQQVHHQVQLRSEARSSHQETGRGIPQGMQRIRLTVCEIFLNGWRSSQIVQRTQKCLHPHTFLRTLIRNVLQKWHQGSTILKLTSQKTEIAKSACEWSWQGPPYRKRTGDAVPRAEKFGDLMTADHKVLNEEGESRNNHRYAVVLQDLATQWIQSYPCKTRTSQETEKSLRKFLDPSERQWGRWISKQSPIRSRGARFSNSMDSILSVQNKNFSGDGKEFTKVSRSVRKAKSQIHWQLIGIWQILWRFIMESPNFNTSSIRDDRHCGKSSTKRKRRNIHCVTTIRLGWEMVGWFHGMLLLLSAKCSRPPARWKTPHERRFGDPLRGPIIPLEQLLNIVRLLHETSPSLTNLERKFYLEYVLDMGQLWEEFGKEFFLVADTEELEKMEASETYPRRSLKKDKISHSQLQMEQQNCWEECYDAEPFQTDLSRMTRTNRDV